MSKLSPPPSPPPGFGGNQLLAAQGRLDAFIGRYERCTGVSMRQGRAGAFYSRVDTKYARTLRMIEGEDIVLEGAPTAGKTTLMRSMGAALRSLGASVEEYPEERDDPMLKQFFADKARFGFWFQMFKLRGRQHICDSLLHEDVELSRSGGMAQRRTRLLDRILPGDMAFAFWNYASGYFSEEQLQIYMQYATKIKYPMPFLVLYLTAPPAHLVEHVKIRGDPDEIALYTPDYFALMDLCYRYALDLSGCAYCVIDWSKDDTGVGVRGDAAEKPNVPLERCMALLEHAIDTVYKDNIERIRAISTTADYGSTEEGSDADPTALEEASDDWSGYVYTSPPTLADMQRERTPEGDAQRANEAREVQKVLKKSLNSSPKVRRNGILGRPAALVVEAHPMMGNTLHGADAEALTKRMVVDLRASADNLRVSNTAIRRVSDPVARVLGLTIEEDGDDMPPLEPVRDAAAFVSDADLTEEDLRNHALMATVPHRSFIPVDGPVQAVGNSQ